MPVFEVGAAVGAIAKAVGGYVIGNFPWKDIGETAFRLRVSEGMACSASSVSALNKCLPRDQKPFTRQTLAYFIGAFISVEYTTTKDDAQAEWLRQPEEVVKLLMRDFVIDESSNLTELLLNECKDISSIPTLFPEITKSVRDDSLSTISDEDGSIENSQNKSIIKRVSNSATKTAKTGRIAASNLSRITKKRTVGVVLKFRQDLKNEKYIELYHDVLIDCGLGSSEVRRTLLAKFNKSASVDKVMRRTTKLGSSQ